MLRTRTVAVIILGGTASFVACSGGDDGSGGGGDDGFGGLAGAGASLGNSGGAAAASASGGGGGSSASGGSGTFIDGGGGSGGLDEESACGSQKAEATLVKKPVDIVFIIDNSGSMTQEIKAVQDNVNKNFADIIGKSGVDYRAILISEHGPLNDESVCIGSPLNQGNCKDPKLNTAPKDNPPIFYHYDNDDVESRDSWCKLLDWYDEPDRYNMYQKGWGELLRADSFKVFVEITDDGVWCNMASGPKYYFCTSNGGGIQNYDCDYDDGVFATSAADERMQAKAAAAKFDADLLALDPAQFGTEQERNYVWYSIVGLKKKSDGTAYEPNEPIETKTCKVGGQEAPNPGSGYQALSILTGGLRFPVCEGSGFDVVFQKIAEGVIAGAKVSCEFPVPETEPGKPPVDVDSVEIEYEPGDGSQASIFEQVPDAMSCKPGAFYVDGDTLQLCPATCDVVQQDDAAKLGILYGCKSEVN